MPIESIAKFCQPLYGTQQLVDKFMTKETGIKTNFQEGNGAPCVSQTAGKALNFFRRMLKRVALVTGLLLFIWANASTGATPVSTFLGGSGDDAVMSMVVDKDGNIYMTGATDSPNFPITPGGYDTTLNGGFDVFVLKFDSNLQNLLASTLVGGSGYDVGRSITLDGSGNVYVSGFTNSSDFPTNSDSYDATHNSGMDAFLIKLDGNLQHILSATYLGGGNDEMVRSVAVDSNGFVYVVGQTGSPNFPTSSNAYDKSHNGSDDIFISKFDANLNNLVASTFLGGIEREYDYFGDRGIAINSSGIIYVVGVTRSSDFPTTSPNIA